MPVCFAEFQDPVPLAAGRAVLLAQLADAAQLPHEADASGGLVPAAASRLTDAHGPRVYPLRALWDGTCLPPRRIIELRLNDACWRLELEHGQAGYRAVAVRPMAGPGSQPVPDIWQVKARPPARVAA
jgi:hypothetical protein